MSKNSFTKVVAFHCIWLFVLSLIPSFPSEAEMTFGPIKQVTGNVLPDAKEIPRPLYNPGRRNQTLQPSAKPEPLPVEATKPEEALFGDVNRDGLFDADDIFLIVQFADGFRYGSEEELSSADLNQDGEVDIQDAFLGIAKLLESGGLSEKEGNDLLREIGFFMDPNGNFIAISISVSTAPLDVVLKALFDELMRMLKQLQEMKRLQESMEQNSHQGG